MVNVGHLAEREQGHEHLRSLVQVELLEHLDGLARAAGGQQRPELLRFLGQLQQGKYQGTTPR